MKPDIIFRCKIKKINDIEVFSSGTRKLSVEALILNINKVSVFEITFYNKYIDQEAFNLNCYAIYDIQCIFRSEVFHDKNSEKNSFFTHIIGIKVSVISYT